LEFARNHKDIKTCKQKTVLEKHARGLQYVGTAFEGKSLYGMQDENHTTNVARRRDAFKHPITQLQVLEIHSGMKKPPYHVVCLTEWDGRSEQREIHIQSATPRPKNWGKCGVQTNEGSVKVLFSLDKRSALTESNGSTELNFS
jgi:hypothetical protein